MKRQHIYKQIALSLLLLVCAAGNNLAWGQETGDKYLKPQTYLDLSSLINKEITVDKNAETGYGIDQAFDDQDNTWWKASEGNGATVTIDFGEEVTIQGMSIWRSGEPTERAQTIKISTSETEEGEYETMVTQGDIPQGTRGNDRYTFTFSEIKTRYLKLEFTTYGSVSAFNEIDFITPITIQHKPAKWHSNSEFTNEEYYGPEENIGEQLQATHTMIDTIYMHPGQSIQLSLPDRLDNSLSSCSYQRWFSLRTGKSFATTQPNAPVKDILTPTDEGVYYRFTNGYVGNPLYESSTDGKLKSMNFYMPTEEEFTKWFGEDTGFDPNWYVVACDVSYYTDFGKNGDESFTDSYTEPTLSHRIVYYIQNVEAEENWYHKAWDAGDDKFLEEYEIHLPFTRYPDGDKLELVALSKDAWAYADPDNTNESPENITLSVEIENQNSAGIELITKELTGANRVIQFDYPHTNDSEGTKSVNGDVANPTSVIVVKKGEKNLVKFTLKFTKGTSLMTQSMIDALNKGDADLKNTSWGSYKERTPQYMDKNYQFLAGLDFDYEDANPNTFANGAVKVHPYPLGWDDCSYGFYDGSSSGIQLPSGTTNAPQWGYYGIVSGYMEAALKYNNKEWGWTGNFVNGSIPETTAMEKHKENINDENAYSTYHLYVDASDRPGVIARLPFGKEVTFCAGSELFFSAWVKSAKFDNTVDNAAMLFTFMGVTNDGKYEPLYRHQTGQIPATYLNNDINGLPGFGTEKNEWFQVTGSFITDEDIISKYVSYVLQIENNSASTRGGDMYLDDVRVYLKNVEAEVNQLESTCSGTRTRLNFSIDWEQLLSRTGEPDLDNGETSDITFPNDGKGEYSAIGICFIDRRKYESLIQEGISKTEAIKKAHVNIGSNKPNEDGTEPNYYDYAAMFYRLSHEGNTDYDKKAADGIDFGKGALAMNNEWFFYKKEIGGRRILTVDFYAELQPYTPYTMIVVPLDPGNSSETPNISSIRINLKADTFADVIDDTQCAIQTDVSVTSQSLITVDGEIIDPDKDYCAGQILNFAVQLQAPTGEGGALEPVEETVYFDWFFGTEEVFTAQNANEVSLEESLLRMRESNGEDGKKAESVEDVEKLETDNTSFTESMKNLILECLQEENPRLVLRKENYKIRLQNGGLNLVVQPIYVDDIDDENQDYRICWEYIPLKLETNGQSPVAHIGFHDVTYPTLPDTDEPNIRIGLAQIKEAKGNSTALKINLRGVDLINEGGELSLNEENTYIYLVGTNDPEINLEGYTDLDLPIGTLHEIQATESGNNNGSNYIHISFDLEGKLTNAETNSFKFNPKEGYEYELKIYFQERVDNNSRETVSLCDGIIRFKMKVVPEYQKWIGDANDNWNNDDNWARSTKDELKKADNDSYPDYTTGDEPTDRELHAGYVPMRFTRVTIPGTTETGTAKQVELYAAAENESASGTTHKILNLVTTEVLGEATSNIEYDLMVKSATDGGANYKYDCEPYYSNTVDQIHFEPKAEMLHAELLDYEKAWVDYKLESNQWHTLASPLQGVVAGDFYTDSEAGSDANNVAGTENQEYFTDIYFEESKYTPTQPNGYNIANSRISPSVYQRGWKGETNMVSTDNKSNDVAVAGNWSAVYNDVAEPYNPGTGFSLKVLNMPTGADADGNAVFRLPKADETFTYFNANGDETETKSDKIERKNAGKLKISTSDANTEDDVLFTVTSLEAHGDYYLIGNPFMAYLNAKAFFEKNSNLADKYWYVEDDVQNIVAVTDDELISTSDANKNIPPLRSFFVKKGENATEPVSVTFTKDMQVLGGTEDDNTNTNALILTAQTADGKTSRAAIAYDATAKATYETSEDAELFLDSNLSDVPTIYTVAGTMATSINRTSELYNIPVGIYGNSTEMVTLSFDGLKNFSSATLYDAEKRTETPLREGTTITLPANTSGRYFLRAGAPTANESIATDAIQIYTLSGNRVMVTSTAPLKDIRVYTISGALVKQAKGGFCSHELYLPEDGIYVISAKSANGAAQTAKVAVN